MVAPGDIRNGDPGSFVQRTGLESVSIEDVFIHRHEAGLHSWE